MSLTDSQRDWLALAMVPGVGTTYFIRLLAKFGRPEEVLRASEARLTEVVGPKLAQRIRAYKQVVDVERQEHLLAEYDARLITMDDPDYPARLAEIYDPPLVLFVRGTFEDADEPCVAIVGTRKPSTYGIRMAEQIAGDLAARGITVVSGMATGIDAAAHAGALRAGGRTIAVFGCGVDVVYPAENAELMHRIIQHGCVVSPFFMGEKPAKGYFPYRNRIISGMSHGTVVVEAPPDSGSLITARFAAEQGREVFAVPGHASDWNSRGPHALIREGAKLVETVEDIVVELDLPVEARVAPAGAADAAAETDQAVPRPAASPTAAPVPAKAAPKAQAGAPTPKAAPAPAVSGVEREVLAVLSPDGSFVDEIAMSCRISVSEALSSLTMLELKGLVRQFSGKRFAPR
ncbi:MAG: DNA-protecting protein DprA [Candidatus Hydrogenedentes bacterium]|nr:DNA-protecting protein DprA [Candidatus Hydrogenedentota bacterium]